MIIRTAPPIADPTIIGKVIELEGGVSTSGSPVVDYLLFYVVDLPHSSRLMGW